jgi:hypothetical protein
MSRVALVIAASLVSCSMVFGQANMKVPEPKEKKHAPPAAQPVPKAPVNQPVVGKTGEHAKAFDTSTTASTGEETPGPQTTNGLAQQPDAHAHIHPTYLDRSFAAPPNWEQVGQTEDLANGNAAAAYRAEYDGPQGTLGVRGKPATRTDQAKPALTPSNEHKSNGKTKKQPSK